jgi:hypothetical protein
MSARLAAICLCAGIGLVGAACADEPSAERVPEPVMGEYVSAAEQLMVPVGQLASAIGDRASNPGAPVADRAELQLLVQRAHDGLRSFRAIDPGDDGLRFQQARTAVQYALVVEAMPAAVDALESGRTVSELAAECAPFFAALAALPAAAEPGP